MSIKNKGFVLLETIIVMSVLLIGMILLYSNYNRIFMNSGKISYYDNVEDYWDEADIITWGKVNSIFEADTEGNKIYICYNCQIVKHNSGIYKWKRLH